MAITVQITGAQTLLNDLRQLPERMESSVIRQMSQIAYDSAQAGAGRHSKTGALFRSLYNRSIPKGREVGHDPQMAPHALFVNFGTKPHKIHPKNKKALRWAGGGAFHFAKFVSHPGYRGDNYMQAAADAAVVQFAAIVTAAMRENQ
jgi:hypothetical protein